MIQIKWNQSNEERFEVIRYLPGVFEGVSISVEETYWDKYLRTGDWRK